MSYWLKFEPDFDFDGEESSGGKLPGLGSGAVCSGGQICDGSNGFTSRYMWRDNGMAFLYLYHMDKPGDFGENIELGRFFQRGQWHNLIQRVKINDGNKKNGEIDVWMDGQQVLSKKNIQFVNNGDKINTMFFNTFHGGSGPTWWPERDVHAYFDEFIISTDKCDVGL